MKRSMKAHATEEMRALQRGGASPRLMKEERDEYAKKGVKLPAVKVRSAPTRKK